MRYIYPDANPPKMPDWVGKAVFAAAGLIVMLICLAIYCAPGKEEEPSRPSSRPRASVERSPINERDQRFLDAVQELRRKLAGLNSERREIEREELDLEFAVKAGYGTKGWKTVEAKERCLAERERIHTLKTSWNAAALQYNQARASLPTANLPPVEVRTVLADLPERITALTVKIIPFPDE